MMFDLSKFKEIKVDEHKSYLEMDGIRLVVEDGVVTGWYEPELDRVL